MPYQQMNVLMSLRPLGELGWAMDVSLFTRQGHRARDFNSWDRRVYSVTVRLSRFPDTSGEILAAAAEALHAAGERVE